MSDYRDHDQEVWDQILGRIPPEWYETPASDAMEQCTDFFAGHACERILDLACGFGRWAMFLAKHIRSEIVGVDYSEHGITAADTWKVQQRDRILAFLVADVLALPFRPSSFDGVVAALILDNLDRNDLHIAVDELNVVTAQGSPGFFVFNPPEKEVDEAAMEDNPTKECMHVDYTDDELITCLRGWDVLKLRRSKEGFRLIEARRT